MADQGAGSQARLAEIAERLADLEESRRFYLNLIDSKSHAHARRRRRAGAAGIGIASAGAALGFVIPPLAGVAIAAAGVVVPWWVQSQDQWDKNVVAMAERGLKTIQLEADRLTTEVRRIRDRSAGE